ncbi:hypothetical protein FK535_06970 [Mycolicibacterium sp. 018/SC-01/001]|uniref:GAP1-N2 domain-containing protein n=1 Tax=Mycolicibacterium sp. 018/SC-01/001 TaxID=2592069 RepID=UPI0011810FCA|nr:hypothetical protein [Mycolicibacterium sp. 018/SC-01/001]TRW86207.1 hypothetical protein FK535_06970 [Mycolicibacterium sp. 018/SC-01/001]
MPNDTAQSTTQFAQLIYTSFDDDSSSGGWQIKAETGELTPTERQALTSRIVTRFDVGRPLPAYPTQEEISGRPARLAYAPLTSDSAAYWHTVDAGADGTGRPGNVMAHVLLDRNVRCPSPLRPVQLWDSPKWLRPFGAADVAATTLDEDDLPQPGAGISVESVVQFLTGTTIDRQSVFRVLLDAVYAAMAGGPGIMLITHEPGIGVMWIAAVSYFMSPGAARRFSWCSHDDPNLAVTDLRRGTHLVVVSEDATTKAAAGQWVVIDDAEEPGIGQPGSSHRTSHGHVAVTGWSVLAEGVLESARTATKIIGDQDAIAAAVGDVDLSPAWPLAVAVRRDPALQEYHKDANHVVADDQPANPQAVDWIADIVAEAGAATAPADAPESLVRLTRAHTRGVGVATAARRLLQTALADMKWLELGPLNDVPQVEVVSLEEAQPVIGAALAQVRGQYPDSAAPEVLHLAVRIAELLGRLCAPESGPHRSSTPLRGLIAHAVTALESAATANILRADTAISVFTRERDLRPAVATLPEATLYQLDISLWAWLFGDDQPEPVVPANPYAFDRKLLAHYILATLEGPLHAVVGEKKDRLAADGAYLALDAEGLEDEDCRRLIDAISRVSHIDANDLAAMMAQQPSRIAPAAAAAALLYEAVPNQLITVLASRPNDSAGPGLDRFALTAARLRALHPATGPWTDEQLAQALADAQYVYDQFPSIDHVSMAADELIEVLAVLFVIAQMRGDKWANLQDATAQALAQRLDTQSATLATALAEHTRLGTLDVEWFAGRSLLQRIGGFDVPALLTEDEQGTGLEGAVLADLIERQHYSGPTEVKGLRDCAWEQVRSMGAEEAERFFEGYARAARAWLHQYSLDEGGSRRGFLRPNF